MKLITKDQINSLSSVEKEFIHINSLILSQHNSELENNYCRYLLNSEFVIEAKENFQKLDPREFWKLDKDEHEEFLTADGLSIISTLEEVGYYVNASMDRNEDENIVVLEIFW